MDIIVLAGLGGIVLAVLLQRLLIIGRGLAKITAKKFHLSNWEAYMIYIFAIAGVILAVIYG